MENITLEVLKTSHWWLARGLCCELMTVLKTWGSSPRPEGSMLTICENGRVVGSVSGGCIEDESRFVAQITQNMDYAVTVCDPREAYRDTWQVSGVTLTTGMPDDVVQAMKLDMRCAVIALTHYPKLDDLALMEALRSEAYYVDALGSRLNNQRRRERLAEHFELSAAQLDKLHGPIGLYIGSKTLPGIAISILAELTAVKNAVALPHGVGIETAKALAGLAATGAVCALFAGPAA